MALVASFDPPAFMSDLDSIPGGREAWHQFVSACFTASINAQKPKLSAGDGGSQTVQFFDPTRYDPGEALVIQAIGWNAFPKELLVRFGRDDALVQADRLWPLAAYRDPNYDPNKPGQTAIDAKSPGFYRPLNEYCEWHVERDPVTNLIRRVTFTSEPPEYWQAMFGGNVAIDDDINVAFRGNPQRVLELYRDLVSPDVQLEDLVVKRPFGGMKPGDYNIYNKWNSTHGIAHLAAPPNSLGAEVRLGADATIIYRNSRDDTVVQADALICCGRLGGPDRNSDPTIGSAVNALARAGAMITLVNPVGLYMDHVDLTGWTLPDGIAPSDCVRIVRGRPGMIERLVVEVPPETGRSLGQVTIGGVPIAHGGHIAECITVKLVGGAARIGSVKNGRVACGGRCCMESASAAALGRAIALTDPTPVGMVDAFLVEGGFHDVAGVAPVARDGGEPVHVFAMRRLP